MPENEREEMMVIEKKRTNELYFRKFFVAKERETELIN